ncbi:MAG: hypothetical protein MMC23_000874 [Stictis urceolatum]|nr:hypothetical protein [Stictis urceolata]
MPLGLYKDLMRSATPMTVEQLAEEAKAQPLLVGTIACLVDLMREAYTDSIARVLRVISVVELVNEVDRDLYAASPVAEVMASTAMTAAGKALVSLTLYPHSILEPDRSSWDQSANSMAKFPEFLEQREFSCPSDPEDGLFQYAFGTRLGAFEHWSRDAKVFDNFNVFHRMDESWLSWYPVKSRLLEGLDQSSAVLVDIGGGKGQNLHEFSETFPQEHGRLILQDRLSVIDDIESLNGSIKRQAHNFFTPQPVEGARTYFFSRIFHDWSDERCREILRNLRSAMTGRYSKLLIHDFVLSDTDCFILQAGFDTHMMCMHAGMERTRHRWEYFLHESGFQVVRFWIPPDDSERIIEAE